LRHPRDPKCRAALHFLRQAGLWARLPDRWAGASALLHEERQRALPWWARYGMVCWTTAQACAQAQVPYRWEAHFLQSLQSRKAARRRLPSFRQ
jgi:hypothetical protein